MSKASPTKNEPKQPQRAKRWRRWLWRMAVAAVIARLLLALFLLPLASFGAGFAGLSLQWRSASLSLLGLSVTIEDLVVRVADDDSLPPLLTAQELVADVSMRQLLGGDLAIVDISLAGARVTLQQAADGQLRLPDAWLEQAPVTPAEPPATDQQPLSFELPLRVASARVHDLQFDLVDLAADPPHHLTARLDLDIADVGFPDRRGSITLRGRGPEIGDDLFVQAQLQTSAQRAHLRWQAAVHGWRPGRYDLPAEIVNALRGAHVVDLTLGGELTAEVLASAPRQAALQGRSELRVALDGVERTALDATFGPAIADPARPGSGLTMPFALSMHIDDVLDQLQLENGRLMLADDRTAITAELSATGLTGRRLRPLLEAAGLALPPAGLSFQANVDAEFGEAMSLDLRRLSVQSGADQLLDLTRVAVRDLRNNDGTLAIGEVELIGPELPIRRDADGTLVIAGLRTTAGPAVPVTTIRATNAAPGTGDGPLLPKIRLGSFDWSGARVVWRDESTTPATECTLEDLRVRADAITIGDQAPPGRLVISARVPGVVDELIGELQLQSTASSLTTSLELRANGLTATALGPMLGPMGITPELSDGELGLTVTTELRLMPDQLSLDAKLLNLRLVDGDKTWLRLRRIEGTGLTVSGDDFEAGTWTITEPFLAVHRDDEALHVLGLRIASPRGPTPAPTAAAAAEPNAPRLRMPRGVRPNTEQPLFRHGELRLGDATIGWTDTRYPGRTWSVGLDAMLGENRGEAKPLPLQATLRLPGAMQSFTVDGTLALTPTRTIVDGTIAARGIRGSEFSSFLPDGTACTLLGGSLDATFAATITNSEQTSVDATLSGLRLLDNGVELAAIDDVTLAVPVASGPEIHVRDVHVRGVRAIVTMTPAALHVPGFALSPTAPPVTAPNDGRPSPAPGEPATTPPPHPSAALTLPRLRIDAMAFALDRFELRDRRTTDAEPLIVSGEARLSEAWFGDPTADEPGAMQWQIDASCAPLGAALTAAVQLSPFALAPTVDMQIGLSGFDTTRLTQVAPSLAAQLQGDATALAATVGVHGRLDLKRRDASQFDFSRPFGGELVVEDFVLRDAATERTFASVRAIDVVARAIDPRNGAVLLRSVDVDEPLLRLERHADGLHVGGFRLPPPPAPKSTTAADPSASGGPATTSSAAEASPSPAPPATESELAIDRLRVLGVTFDYKDTTTTPPTRLLCVDTDATVQRFTTLALSEPRPLSFSLAVRGGNVELEKRILSSSVVAGFLGSAVDAVTGSKDRHAMQERPLVDEISASGQLQLHPRPKGRVTAVVNGLELAAFRGLAKQGGVDLADGVYDMRLELDLLGYDGIEVRSRHVLTWLQLSEPPDGPISTYLRLPAPLQSVLFLLRNDDDEQRLPLNLKIPATGLSQGQVVDLAAESLTRIISDAVSSAGSRITSTLTAGLLGGTTDVPDVAVKAEFAAGSPLPDATDYDALVAAAVDHPTLSILLTHELGQGDVPLAGNLANPPAKVVGATIERLQRRQRELAEQREPLATEVVALYAAARHHEARRRHAELEALDSHLGELEGALAEALLMIGPDNPRVARRRTRAACQALADARLDAIVDELETRHPELSGRIERRPGRGLPIDGLPDGGQVLAVLRRRSAR